MRCFFRYSLLSLSIAGAMLPSFQALAQTLEPVQPVSDGIDTGEHAPAVDGDDQTVSFDTSFLNVSGESAVDLTRFAHSGSALPGVWPTDIYVNDELITHQPVTFVETSDRGVEPCLSLEILKKIRFNPTQLPPSYGEALRTEQACYSLQRLVPQAHLTYDSGIQRLDISIPQAMMNNTARGYVSPELWDSGIPALLLGYSMNTYTMRARKNVSRSGYLGLNGGVNIGGWYFRHDGNYNWQQNSGGQYQSLNNYVQRDIPAIKGRIRLGEANTRGMLFDTLPFRGVELVSDERMQPQSRRGYAPDIRGIARTNARVTIRQSDRVIYETTVSPGAFVINDLYPTGYGGNLEVIVTEADGSSQSFLVPYASVTQLLRPGAHHYDFVLGQFNDPSLHFRPELYQLTYQRGLTNTLTGYGGVQSAGNDYNAVQAGLAVSTAFGAISADITQAKVDLQSSRMTGQSYQLSYSKYLPVTNSNLTIAAYRFSTSGYFDYLAAMRSLDEVRRGRDVNGVWRPKNRFNITMNQGLPGNGGQVYLTGYTQDYWNNGSADLQYQVGYSNSWKNISYSLSVGRVRTINGRMESSGSLNFTIPFGGRYSPTLNVSLNRDGGGNNGEQLGVSGTFGDDNQYNYGMTAMRYGRDAGNSVALNGGWRSPYTHFTATYGAGKGYQNTSLNASGTVLAWPWGITGTPYTGDTFAIVEAKGASGAKVSGYSGVRIDPWGHAAVPYLNPYEMNEITLDPRGLGDNVELENTSEKIAPYAGAVGKVVFKTHRGIPLLISARLASGEPVPFGAGVYDDKNTNIGSVGQAGQAYARVDKEEGTLTVQWGAAAQEQCHIRYSVLQQLAAGNGDTKNFIHLESLCL